MEEEVDDIKFETLLADKRHKELKKSLSDIASSLSKIDNDDVVAAIKKQTDKIEDFANAIKSIPAAEVNVDLTALQKIADDILKAQGENKKLLSELVQKSKAMKEWSFSFKRGQHSIIESPIIATQIK